MHEGHYCTLFSFLCNSLISIILLINALLYYSACGAQGNIPEDVLHFSQVSGLEYFT